MTVRADAGRDRTTLLDGFLPLIARRRPAGTRQAGRAARARAALRTEPAITRHLAAFLTRAAAAASAPRWHGAPECGAVQRRLLHAGGGAHARARRAVERGPALRPAVLENERPEAAVAIGAAFYAGCAANPGALAAAVSSAPAARAPTTSDVAGERRRAIRRLRVCRAERRRARRSRSTASSPSSPTSRPRSRSTAHRTRRCRSTTLVTFTGDDDVYRHAPLVTALRFGKRSRRVPLAVRLTASCSPRPARSSCGASPRRRSTAGGWRSTCAAAEADPLDEDADDDNEGGEMPSSRTRRWSPPMDWFGRPSRGSIDGMALALSSVSSKTRSGFGKQAWPLPALRVAGGRAASLCRRGAGSVPRTKARWLNLTGFCTRPGFGAPLDPWRMSRAAENLLCGRSSSPRTSQCQVEWLVLWQRVAAGFTAAISASWRRG